MLCLTQVTPTKVNPTWAFALPELPTELTPLTRQWGWHWSSTPGPAQCSQQIRKHEGLRWMERDVVLLKQPKSAHIWPLATPHAVQFIPIRIGNALPHLRTEHFVIHKYIFIYLLVSCHFKFRDWSFTSCKHFKRSKRWFSFPFQWVRFGMVSMWWAHGNPISLWHVSFLVYVVNYEHGPIHNPYVSNVGV